MNIEDVRSYCLSKAGTEETTPFGPDVLVYKLLGKIFLLMAIDNERPSINVKCNPEWAIELREAYEEIVPGYHMNKKHWNTIYLNGLLHPSLILKCIDHSYSLIYESLPIKTKTLLNK